jgi:hypothetical protein
MTEPNEQAYRDFQRHVDRLCFLIVATDCSEREIDIERLHLRVQAMHLFPDKIPLYELIYERRFRRLREQFRQSSTVSGPENHPSASEQAS